MLLDVITALYILQASGFGARVVEYGTGSGSITMILDVKVCRKLSRSITRGLKSLPTDFASKRSFATPRRLRSYSAYAGMENSLSSLQRTPLFRVSGLCRTA